MPPGRPKKEKQPSATDLAIIELSEAIKKLEISVDRRLKVLEEVQKTPHPAPQVQPVNSPPAAQSTSATVPFEWRQVIDDVLSPAFGVAVRYLDGANFELTIDVPQAYSNSTKTEWDTNHHDHRVKIMPNYLGAQGIKDYCELIAKNLGVDIMRKIQDDKTKQPA